MSKNKLKFKNIDDLPVRITDWIGSSSSIIVHTIFFIGIFVLTFIGVGTTEVLLILTTVVSLEAIYLAIFIQMTVNRNTQSLEEVEEDIEDIEKDIDKIEEDVDKIEEDVDKLEEEEKKDDMHDAATAKTLSKIEADLQRLVEDIAKLRQS